MVTHKKEEIEKYNTINNWIELRYEKSKAEMYGRTEFLDLYKNVEDDYELNALKDTFTDIIVDILEKYYDYNAIQSKELVHKRKIFNPLDGDTYKNKLWSAFNLHPISHARGIVNNDKLLKVMYKDLSSRLNIF